MCLAIPMSVIEIAGFNARCEARGIVRSVSLFLMQHEPIMSGDIVMVHMGYAIQKVTPEDAKSAWDLYDEMLAAQNDEPATLVPLLGSSKKGSRAKNDGLSFVTLGPGSSPGSKK